MVILDDLSQLPEYLSVLSADGQDLALPQDAREDLAVLLLPGRKVLILKSNQASLQQVQHLRHRAGQSKYAIEIRPASRALIASVGRLQGTEDRQRTALETNETHAIHEFRQWLQHGIDQEATDIHIEMRERLTALRYRISGKLYSSKPVDSELARAAVSNAYLALADDDTRTDPEFSFTAARNCIVQTDLQVDGCQRIVRLRMQTTDVAGGLDAVIRVPRTRSRAFTLEEMGFSPSQIRLLSRFVRRRDQLLVVCGATGSGKTELLNALHFLDPNRHYQKIFEIGDPVEIRNPEISQISVQRSSNQDSRGDHAYAEAARMLLRCDPDRAIFSEIRGRDVGDVVTAIVQSGHQVRATTHAASGLDAIARLSSPAIGMHRETVCSRNFLGPVVFMALLPKLCDHCKTSAVADVPPQYVDFIRNAFKLDRVDSIRWRNPVGCEHCRGGVKGQTVAAEVISMNRAILEHLRDHRDAEAEDEYRRQRLAGFADSDMTGKTAFEHGLYKVIHGTVDPRDLEEAFETFEEYGNKMPATKTTPDWGG